MPEFTQEEQEEIIEMFYNGSPAYEIGDCFNADQITILTKLDEWAALDSYKKRTAQDYKQEIIDMYNEGYTCEEIGNAVGFSRGTIYRNLVSWGYEFTRGYVFADHERNKIIKLYENGKSCEYISEIFECNATTIADRLDEWGVERRGIYTIEYSDEDKTNIIQLYEGGLNTYEIADIYETSPPTIRKRLNSWGIETSRFTYYVDDNFFSVIDSENKAYWLGFIFADGYIYKNTLNISIQKGDVKHLKKFLNDLQSNYPVYSYEENSTYSNAVEIKITSKQLVNDLAKYGVVPNKTHIVKPPTNIPTHLLAHFWRGWVDGDGHVGIMKSKGNEYPVVNLVGTYAACEGFKNFCLQYMNSKSNIYEHKDKSLWTYAVRGSFAVPILDVLYSDATIYLDRKYAKAMEILAEASY